MLSPSSSLSERCVMKRLGMSALGKIAGKILGGCLLKSVLTIWCSSLLEDARAVFSVKSSHVAVSLCFVLCLPVQIIENS